MTIHLLKFTRYIENALCVYRNYRLFSKILKSLIMLRMIVELLLITIHCVVRAYSSFLHSEYRIDLLYFYLSSVNSFIVIALGWYHAEKYSNLNAHLQTSYKVFGRNPFENMNLKDFLVVGCMFLLICGEVTTCFIYQIKYVVTALVDTPKIWVCLFEINLFLCNFRYIFEYLVLYCVLRMISEQLQFITRAMDKKVMFNYSHQQLISEVDQCVIIYRNIKKSSELYNHIFGVQLTTMLATTIIYYLIFIYTMTTKRAVGSFTIWEICFFVSTLVLILIILGFLSRAAQVMENNGDMLKKRLCKLLLLSITNPECYRTTRDLLRMMIMRPIRACAFGFISVNMALLPASISFLTTHTVVALQFNNVV